MHPIVGADFQGQFAHKLHEAGQKVNDVDFLDSRSLKGAFCRLVICATRILPVRPDAPQHDP